MGPTELATPRHAKEGRLSEKEQSHPSNKKRQKSDLGARETQKYYYLYEYVQITCFLLEVIKCPQQVILFGKEQALEVLHVAQLVPLVPFPSNEPI